MMTAAARRLLLVEDSEPLGRQMVAALDAAGYETTWIRRGDEALAADYDRFSLVVLDVMLPGASGFDVLADVRRRGSPIPVVIATARAASEDRQRAIDLGAADYLTKPFWPEELLERVCAQLGPAEQDPASDVAVLGEVTVDFAARTATLDGAGVPLTPVEFDVLAALVRRRRLAVSNASLLVCVAKREGHANLEALDDCVSRLKRKLGGAGARIKAVWGVGYRLEW